MRDSTRFWLLPLLLVFTAPGISSCSDGGPTGSGSAGGSCEISPETLDFGSVEVGQSKVLSFTITNTGSRAIRGTLSLGGCTSFELRGGGGNFRLEAGESAPFLARYVPSVDRADTCEILTGTACGPVRAVGVGTAVP